MAVRVHHRHEGSRRKLLAALLVLLGVVLFGVILVLTDRQESNGPNSALETVEINGVTCIPRQNLRTYLFIGVDAGGEETEEYAVGGMCDVLRLVVVDETHNTYTQLPINRATLTNVHTYDKDGKDYGTSYIQIAYAHATAGVNGGPRSCENVVQSVSDLLMGQKIDNYVSLDMEGISVLNHLADGVTVTIEDDFSREDPSLVMGETITLSDEQAEHFVRGRMSVGDGTNENRMHRQDVFIEGLKTRLQEKTKADGNFAMEMYDTLQDVMVTNMNKKEFGRIVNALLKYDIAGERTISGTLGEDDLGFVTLEPDQDSLADTVIDLFYTRV